MMKEVIRRLADEAGFVFWAGEEWAPGSEIDWSSDYDREFNKFVELIVKECAMLVEDFRIDQEVALDEYVEYEASTVIKEHFGIE